MMDAIAGFGTAVGVALGTLVFVGVVIAVAAGVVFFGSRICGD